MSIEQQAERRFRRLPVAASAGQLARRWPRSDLSRLGLAHPSPSPSPNRHPHLRVDLLVSRGAAHVNLIIRPRPLHYRRANRPVRASAPTESAHRLRAIQWGSLAGLASERLDSERTASSQSSGQIELSPAKRVNLAARSLARMESNRGADRISSQASTGRRHASQTYQCRAEPSGHC